MKTNTKGGGQIICVLVLGNCLTLFHKQPEQPNINTNIKENTKWQNIYKKHCYGEFLTLFHKLPEQRAAG